LATSNDGGISRKNLSECTQERIGPGRLAHDRARRASRGNIDMARVDYAGYAPRGKALEEDCGVILAQNEINDGCGQCWMLGKT